MNGHYKVILAIVAIPICALMISKAIDWKIEEDWQKALATQSKDITPEMRSSLTLQRICSDPSLRGRLEQTCHEWDMHQLFKLTAIWTSGGGVGFLFLLVFDRKRIYRVV